MIKRILVWSVLVAAVVGAVAELLPDLAGTVITGGVATVVAFVMAEAAWAARRLLGAEPSRFEDILSAPRELPAIPADLERLRRTFGQGAYSQEEFVARLRPELLRVAAHRLRDTRAPAAPAPGTEFRGMDPDLWAALYAEGVHHGRWKTADLARLLDLIERKTSP